MANKLFQEQQNRLQQNNPKAMFDKFMQNPLGALAKSGFNIPDEYSQDPRQATQYLLNSGKISQDKFNNIMQMAQKMGIKL